MSKLTIAGIRRENQFSPNHIGNDAAIFSLTVQHLRDLGCEVNEYIESDLIIHQFEETAIFNMVRNWTSIHKLQQMEGLYRYQLRLWNRKLYTRENDPPVNVEQHLPSGQLDPSHR